jgi:hypothetical protein
VTSLQHCFINMPDFFAAFWLSYLFPDWGFSLFPTLIRKLNNVHRLIRFQATVIHMCLRDVITALDTVVTNSWKF